METLVNIHAALRTVKGKVKQFFRLQLQVNVNFTFCLPVILFSLFKRTLFLPGLYYFRLDARFIFSRAKRRKFCLVVKRKDHHCTCCTVGAILASECFTFLVFSYCCHILFLQQQGVEDEKKLLRRGWRRLKERREEGVGH